MDRTLKLREIVQKPLTDWADFLPTNDQIQNILVFDNQRDQYIFSRVGWEDGQQISRTVIHLAIENAKILVHTDNTENGIATDLLAAGVSTNEIVMAYRPAYRRELSLLQD